MLHKRQWIDQHIGTNFPAIFDSDKHKYATPNRLLIDDHSKKIDKFTDAGGHGHLFTDWASCKEFLERCLKGEY